MIHAQTLEMHGEILRAAMIHPSLQLHPMGCEYATGLQMG